MGNDAVKEFQKGLEDGARQAASEFDKAGKQIQQSNANLSKSFDGAVSSVKNLASALGIGLSVSAVTSYIKGVVELGSHLANLADQTGIAASTLSQLKTPLENSGSSVDIFSRAIFNAQVQVGQIRISTDPALKAIKDLGLSFEQLRTATPDEFLHLVANALAGVEDTGKRAALAHALFGQATRTVLPALLELAGGLEDVNGLTTEQIDRLNKLSNAWTKFSNDLKFAVADSILSLADFFDDLDRRIADSGEKARSWFRDMLATLHGHAVAAPETPVGAPFGDPQSHTPAPPKGGVTPFAGFEDLAKKAQAVTDSLQKQITTLRAIEIAWNQGEEASTRYKVTQEALTQLHGQQLTPAMKQQIETIVQLTAETKGHELILKLYAEAARNAATAINDLTAAQASMVDIQDKLRKEGPGMTADALESLKTQLLSVVGGMEDAGTATDDTRRQFYNMLKTIESLSSSSAFREAIPSMVESVDRALNDLQVRLGNSPKAINPLLKTYEGLFDQIAGGLNTSVNGVIQGTQTIGEAFRNMGQTILLTLAQIIIQLGILNPLKNAIFGGQTGFTAGPTFSSIFGDLFGGGGASAGSGWSFATAGAGEGFSIVPFMESGGIVPGRSGQAVPIIAHAGERVIPLGSNGNGGSSKVSVTINGDITPRRPEMTREQVIQIMVADADNRGPHIQMLEQRTSPR